MTRFLIILLMGELLFSTQSLALSERAKDLLMKSKGAETADRLTVVCREKDPLSSSGFRNKVVIMRQSPEYHKSGTVLVKEGYRDGVENVPFEVKRIAGAIDVRESLDNKKGHELVNKLWDEPGEKSKAKLKLNTSGHFKFFFENGFKDERLIFTSSQPEYAEIRAHGVKTLRYKCQYFLTPAEITKSRPQSQLGGQLCTVNENDADCIPEDQAADN